MLANGNFWEKYKNWKKAGISQPISVMGSFLSGNNHNNNIYTSPTTTMNKIKSHADFLMSHKGESVYAFLLLSFAFFHERPFKTA